jgi:hypothetical protein
MSNIIRSISDLYKNISDQTKKVSGGKGKKTLKSSAKGKGYGKSSIKGKRVYNLKKRIRGGDGETYSCTSCSLNKPSTVDTSSSSTSSINSGNTTEQFTKPTDTSSGISGADPHPMPKIPATNVTEPVVVHPSGKLPETTSDATQTGGGKIKSAKGAYKKYLNKFNLDILQKEAKRKGIKITTKKNGKVANIKKASLINKIAAKKFSK